MERREEREERFRSEKKRLADEIAALSGQLPRAGGMGLGKRVGAGIRRGVAEVEGIEGVTVTETVW